MKPSATLRKTSDGMYDESMCCFVVDVVKLIGHRPACIRVGSLGRFDQLVCFFDCWRLIGRGVREVGCVLGTEGTCDEATNNVQPSRKDGPGECSTDRDVEGWGCDGKHGECEYVCSQRALAQFDDVGTCKHDGS
jgi:hypothetical protein